MHNSCRVCVYKRTHVQYILLKVLQRLGIGGERKSFYTFKFPSGEVGKNQLHRDGKMLVIDGVIGSFLLISSHLQYVKCFDTHFKNRLIF